MRILCENCGVNKMTSLGKGKKRRYCDSCHKRPYTRNKKSICENCGFVPLHPIQLDVDHIDGNKKNNFPDNLQTLCANCHRLKTLLNNDHLSR